jgi:hypothetical protein
MLRRVTEAFALENGALKRQPPRRDTVEEAAISNRGFRFYTA